MSLYNMINGFNTPACLLLMPMLGRKQEDYPRFRDCFLSEDEQHIDIYTRVGGNNRDCGFGEEKLYEDENYVETFDNPIDNTYATYRFNVPEKWKHDFELLKENKFKEVSDEYVDCIKEFYPLLSEKEIIDQLFRG